MNKIIFLSALLVFSETIHSQKVVFRDEYNTKNISMPTTTSVSAGTARIVNSNTTGEKLLLFCGKKEKTFYLLDQNWRLIEKFDMKATDQSPFKDEDYTVIDSRHNKKKWDLLIKSDDRFLYMTVDFSAGTVTENGTTLQDVKSTFSEVVFQENGKARMLYVDKNDKIIVSGFSENLTPQKTPLEFTTELPYSNTKKYAPSALFLFIAPMDELAARDLFQTRNKLQFYPGPGQYTFLATDNEPVAELSTYDATSGKKSDRHLFSVTDLVPSGIKDKFRSAALLYKNKVHLMVTYNDGAVYAVFDKESRNRVYQKVFTDKDETAAFNFGPVEYETLPGVMNYSRVREKAEDISVKKYIGDLNKHSFGVTAREGADGRLFIAVSTIEFKELAFATSTLRKGINTITSDAWYTSSSAGFIFPAAGGSPESQRMAWAQAMGSDVSGKYQRVQPQVNAEYNEKGTIIIHSQYLNSRQYVIYYKDRELRIFERK